MQRRATSSVAHHLLVNYQRAHIAIIKAQFTSKRLRDGMEVRTARPDLLCSIAPLVFALALICLCRPRTNATHLSCFTCLKCLLQGVLAVAEACGMQNLLKAAGVEYQVHGLHVAVIVHDNSASSAAQASIQ